MNKANTKISFFSNIQNIIKENIKIIIYFIICIVIIIAGYQIYFFNKEKKIRELSIVYFDAKKSESKLEFIENMNMLAKDKSFYGLIASLELINNNLENKNYNDSFNEYLILETIDFLKNNLDSPSQKGISIFSGIDVSVISVCIKTLINKKLITRKTDKDNRKKIINFMPNGNDLFKKIFPQIIKQENYLFDKLRNEKLNFCNSLKLILGKKIRIKAENNYENFK